MSKGLFSGVRLSTVASNIFWLLFDKFFKLSFGLFVFVLVARYLGPSDFGVLNYALAVVGIGSAVCALGLPSLVVRELVDKPNARESTLGTAIVLQIGSAFIVYVAMILAINVLGEVGENAYWMIAVLGLGFFAKALHTLKSSFEALVNSRVVVKIDIAALFFSGLIKLALIYTEAEVRLFAVASLFEVVFVSCALLFFHRSKVGEYSVKYFDAGLARQLLRDGWPLLISSVSWIVYTKIDQVMIGHYVGQSAVGIYAVSIKIGDVINFVPSVIAFTIIPLIMKDRHLDRPRYIRNIQAIYNLTVLIVLVVCLIAFLASEVFVGVLFGPTFFEAAGILNIYIWCSLFHALAVVSGRYLLNEGLQHITMRRHLLGMLVNVVLNMALIPLMGLHGAAVASLIAFAFANYLLDAFWVGTRDIFIQKTKAIFLLETFSMIKELVNARRNS